MLRFLILLALLLITPFSYAESAIGKNLNDKMDQAYADMQNDRDVGKAWQIMTEVSAIIDEHPEYDDGEYAETMSDMVVALLAKPWKYARPYLIGNKSTDAFREFIIDHVNELSLPKDLYAVEYNVGRHCELHKYSFCEQLIMKINNIIASK